MLTKSLQELQNSRIESNRKITEFKDLMTKGLKEVSSGITENMTLFFSHQEKLNSFNKPLEKARNHCGCIWKNSRHKETIILVPLQKFTVGLLQHEPPKMPWKLQPKSIPNEACKDAKFGRM